MVFHQFFDSFISQKESMSSEYGMSKLVETINKLRDACAEVDDEFLYELPQMAVVGSQSAGKSSVLENIVKKDFLPRGTGVVTRCPLTLQLYHWPEEYGEFGHIKGEKFVDFDEIRKEILNRTEQLAGNNKGISKDPIELRIYSPNVPNLTLIDLPGLTKNPIGDQPANIEQQTRDLILQYISKENCLILAVSPANDDLANSEAIKLARQVDKNGDRTIGVLTKLDMMDTGTHARDILDNKVLTLRLGYVGVVNRSQADIEGKKDIQAALEGEANFINQHPQYKQIADRMGTCYLEVLLSQELSKHIFSELPKLQDKLQNQIELLEAELAEYKESYPTDEVAMYRVLTGIIDRLKSDFDKEIGNLGTGSVETDRLTFGTKINKVFFERFPKDIADIASNEEDLCNKINIVVQNLHGVRSHSFTPHMAFESVAKDEILRLKEPVRKCIDLVVEMLSAAIRICTLRIDRYPKIRENVEKKITKHVRSSAPSYKRSVLALIDMEQAYQNTQHEHFKFDLEEENDETEMQEAGKDESARKTSIDSCVSLPTPPKGKTALKSVKNKTYRGPKGAHLLDSNLDSNVEYIYRQIEQYMDIVRRTARDMVPKAIKLYIIDELKDFFLKELLPSLLVNENLAKNFEMNTEQAEDMAKKGKRLEAYQNALEMIRDITNDSIDDTASSEA